MDMEIGEAAGRIWHLHIGVAKAPLCNCNYAHPRGKPACQRP
jgi:hypothetical protein